VSISTSQTQPLTRADLRTSYSAGRGLVLANTGSGWQVRLDSAQSSVSFQGETFRAEQLHAHWGASEHQVDSMSYDGELHIVHYNTKYHSFSEALDKPDGLAVIGVFLTLQEDADGEAGCEELDKICQKLREIKFKNTKTLIKEDFNPERFLPSDRSYFSYLGSLTTPPLLESVTWLIFKQPIKTTKEQLAEMTSLSADPTDSVLLSHNCRPVCPLAGRIVAFHQHK